MVVFGPHTQAAEFFIATYRHGLSRLFNVTRASIVPSGRLSSNIVGGLESLLILWCQGGFTVDPYRRRHGCKLVRRLGGASLNLFCWHSVRYRILLSFR